MAKRGRLSVERIVTASVEVADGGGLAAVSMRNVGKQLGVEAMSLYQHIAGKEQLLDLLADWVFARMELPTLDAPWRPEMRARAQSARRVLATHPWALTLIESRRNPGPALLRYHNTVLGCLRHNGFPVPLATSAFSVLDSYIRGFVLTELTIPIESADDTRELADHLGLSAEDYPYMVEMLTEQVIGGDFTYADEFDFGLDLILDGLASRLARSGAERQ